MVNNNGKHLESNKTVHELQFLNRKIISSIVRSSGRLSGLMGLISWIISFYYEINPIYSFFRPVILCLWKYFLEVSIKRMDKTNVSHHIIQLYQVIQGAFRTYRCVSLWKAVSKFRSNITFREKCAYFYIMWKYAYLQG